MERPSLGTHGDQRISPSSTGSDERARKRVKMGKDEYREVASASTHAGNTENDLIPPSTTVPGGTDTLNAASEHSVSSSLPPLALRFNARLESPSLKLSIMPKTQLDTLKSHNSILRSHNLSLARQNANLRRCKAQAEFVQEEIMQSEPLDHDDCIRKDDYKHVVEENQTLRDEVTKLRYEHQLMKECGFEWARRENLWDVERELLKKEVSSMIQRVDELRLREQQLSDRSKDIENRAVNAEKQVHALKHWLEQERRRTIALQGHINTLTTTDRYVQRGSAYPEL